MLNLGDHAANRRRILQLGDPADLVEFQADQRRALRVVAADCAAGLLDLDHLCGLGHRDNSKRLILAWRDLIGKPVSTFPDHAIYSATTSASPPTRRDCSVDTLMLRRAATERGESLCFSAAKVAGTMVEGV